MWNFELTVFEFLPVINLLLFSIDVYFYQSLIYFFLAMTLCLEMTDCFALSNH